MTPQVYSKFYIDGGTHGINGRGATGIYWSIRRYDDTADYMIAERVSTTEYNTNNQAEYAALIDVLTYIHTQPNMVPIGNVIINSDSQLLVRQVNNNWRAKDPTLHKLRGIAQTLIGALTRSGYTIVLQWVPRATIVEYLGH